MKIHPPCPTCGAKSHIHRYEGDRIIYRCSDRLNCGRTHRLPSPNPPGRPRIHSNEAERMRKLRREMTLEQKAAEVVKRRERRHRQRTKQSEQAGDLAADIQAGIDSGPAVPLDMTEIKRRARERRAIAPD